MCIPTSPPPPQNVNELPMGDGLAARARLAILARKQGDAAAAADRAQRR